MLSINKCSIQILQFETSQYKILNSFNKLRVCLCSFQCFVFSNINTTTHDFVNSLVSRIKIEELNSFFTNLLFCTVINDNGIKRF